MARARRTERHDFGPRENWMRRRSSIIYSPPRTRRPPSRVGESSPELRQLLAEGQIAVFSRRGFFFLPSSTRQVYMFHSPESALVLPCGVSTQFPPQAAQPDRGFRDLQHCTGSQRRIPRWQVNRYMEHLRVSACSYSTSTCPRTPPPKLIPQRSDLARGGLKGK